MLGMLSQLKNDGHPLQGLQILSQFIIVLWLQGWIQYLHYGIPSLLMMCLEWWLVEIASMVSGLLDNPRLSLSVMGICLQMVSLAFMVPLGICTALRIRVSNLLGASDIPAWRMHECLSSVLVRFAAHR
jgi:Na+-driven multidrug efflux pump